MQRWLSTAGGLLLLAASLLPLSLRPATAQAQEGLRVAEILDLGTHGGPESGANAINRHGHVVGWADGPTPEAYRTAFLWTPERGMRNLGGLRGNPESQANDINDHGQIVGTASTTYDDDRDRAVLWSRGSGARSLYFRGFHEAGANGINNEGVVVGWADDSAGPNAVVWRQAGSRAQHLSHRDEGTAHEVSDGGVVVGWGDHGININETAWRWLLDSRPRGQVKILRPEHGEGSGQDIDPRGNITGEANGIPFLATGEGVVLLGMLPGYERPADLGAGFGVWGETVVGSFWTGRLNRQSSQARTNERAFIWHDHVLMDLNALLPPDSGWELECANDIYEDRVVGYGRHNGVRRAFLLRLTGR